MPPDEPTDEEQREQTDPTQDSGTPFQPAAPSPDPTSGTVNDPLAQGSSDNTLDDTHPTTDTNNQPEEQYDEGVSGAAEASEPNAGNTVTGYTPPTPPPSEPTSPPTDDTADDGDAQATPGDQDVGPGQQSPA